MKTALAVALVLLVLFVAYIYGSFDKFEAPIEIVIPAGVNGIICAQILNADASKASATSRFEVSPTGRFAIPEGVIRSHRVRKIFRKNTNGQLTELPARLWSGIRTENDPASGKAFAVYWLGTSEDWATFSRAHGAAPFCRE